MELRETTAIHSTTLIATARGWRLQFAFPGPDARYRWDYFEISQVSLSDFRQRLQAAFAKFEQMSAFAQSQAELVAELESNITVRVNGPFAGVCLCGYRKLFSSRDGLDVLLLQLDRVAERGRTLTTTLAAMG
jgi:hypothetical protein